MNVLDNPIFLNVLNCRFVGVFTRKTNKVYIVYMYEKIISTSSRQLHQLLLQYVIRTTYKVCCCWRWDSRKDVHADFVHNRQLSRRVCTHCVSMNLLLLYSKEALIRHGYFQQHKYNICTSHPFCHF
jgi:hypothetical protein